MDSEAGMDYDMYVTRARRWHESASHAIDFDEWLAVVEDDAELSFDNAIGPAFARWDGFSSFDEVWLEWRVGHIRARRKDPFVVEKLIDIASALGARVVGERGEEYPGPAGDTYHERPPCEPGVVARLLERLRFVIRGSTVLAILACCAIWCAPARATPRVDLNGEWQFRTDPQKRGVAEGWTRAVPAPVETVRVPHTWNLGAHEDYEGTAWYFKTFELPDALRAKHVELHFGATFYRSRVWFNGVELGRHEGGYTAYHFDVTPHLGRVNLIAVEIDNMPTASTIPGWALRLRDNSRNVWYDWWHYGGIVRDVWLRAGEPALVRRQQIRTHVTGRAAAITTRVFLENASGRPVAGRLVARVVPPKGGPPVAAAEASVTLKPGAQEQTLSLRIDDVELWHFDRPSLYRLEISLLDAKGGVIDSHADTFGARTIELRARRLYLNGERVRLSGVTRHEESTWEGLAETRGTILHDFDDLKSLHATFTRPVHYPQHPDILDYCDRNGILLVPEIPMWQFTEEQMSDPKVIAIASRMMREMIEQGYNHPSIMAWSVCNESETFTPGGIAYVRAMKELVDDIDPDRFVTFADDSLPSVKRADESAASLADFIMWNQYFGTWAGSAELLPETIERIGKLFPDKMIVISEFGAAGIFAPDAPRADELRSRVLRDQVALFSRYDFVGGLVFWCYQDYRSHRNLRPGVDQGFVEMGLVDEERQRRPSYFLWRELNAPATIAVDWNPRTTYTPPAGFRSTVARRGVEEIPSYALGGYRLVWEVWDDDDRVVSRGERVLPEIGPPHVVEASWQAPQTKAVRLRLRLYRPTGFLALERTLEWWQPRSDGQDLDEMRQRGTPPPE